ncbi:putative bifunctional diguanylate cyclase/phosphodiesterase [Acinetobacter sp. MD2(2019)]|uniref:putative bifunctional diguanylate cyclase/phosphodiesterase n=1 Tax=Acinetobacter sp. MD2(2019) TaxID=2605273 RepID=UPI002D77C363|nr:EAL domain-containing protein [Acinetobacter sp. MD2(2019)]
MSFVVGSFITATWMCYAVIAAQQLLFRTLKPQYKLTRMFGVAVLLGTVMWIILIRVMLLINMAVLHSFNFVFSLASYVIALCIPIIAISVIKKKYLTKLTLFLAAIGLAIASWFSYELAARAFLPAYILQVPSLSSRIAIVALMSVALLLIFWLARKASSLAKVTPFRIIISFLLGGSLIALQSIYIPYVRNISEPELLNFIQERLLISEMLIVTVFSTLIIVFLHWLEWCLNDRDQKISYANDELSNLIQHDSLTQLPNRNSLNQHIKKIFSQYRLHQQGIAFIGIDLDRFKAINDAFGHHVGDELLQEFSRRLSQVLNADQTLFKIGGDEFLCVAEHCSIEQAEALAETILECINAVFSIDQNQINITASLGISMYPEHGKSLQELLMHTDIAMLEAKSEGRNTFHVFNFNLGQYQQRHQSKLINDLFKAIEENQFVLFYQPKFTDQTVICGVEALIRWQHPKLGLLSPNMFIPLAEATGSIIPLGYWVMEQACKQIQEWELKQYHYAPISINLSAVQIEHKGLIARLESLLQQYQVNPNHLIIEITESTAMHNIEFSIEIFRKIRRLGVRLSIDDFGTGHSSFVYLKDLPVNELKIDRAFIQTLTVGSKDELVLASLIQLAKSLGLMVTIEGVETEMQFEILKNLGCKQFQGFLLGKPMPKEVFEVQMQQDAC